jgi:hypothetical protein
MFALFMIGDDTWSADFSGFYTGWAMVVDGRGAQLYDFDLQRDYQTALLDGKNEVFPNGMLRFSYPPHTAVFFAPLALLQLDYAYALWAAIQVAMLVGLLALLRDLARDWLPHEQMLLLSGVVAFAPLLNTLILGAFSLWTLFFTVLFYRGLKHQHEERAGIWLALSTIKPQNVVSLGMIALGGRRWRLLFAGLIAGLGIGVVTGIATYWLAWLDFFRVVSSPGISSFPTAMYNVRGTLLLLLGADAQAVVSRASLLLLALAMLVILWLWRGKWNPHAPGFEPRMALTVCLGMLFSPHHYAHDSLMYVLPAVLLYSHLRMYRPQQVPFYAAFVLSMPLIFFASGFLFDAILGIRLPVIAALVLIGWSAWAMWHASAALAEEAGMLQQQA